MNDSTVWRCTCTAADQGACAGDELGGTDDNGGCGCPCHGIYADDPENWQPLYLRGAGVSDEEIAASYDWLARMDAAEALVDETTG